MTAEKNSLKRMTKSEQELLLQLTKKQFTYFEEEIEKLTGEKSEKKL